MRSSRSATRRTAVKRNSPHMRSEEHTSELQSLTNLVCRLLLEKKKEKKLQVWIGVLCATPTTTRPLSKFRINPETRYKDLYGCETTDAPGFCVRSSVGLGTK